MTIDHILLKQEKLVKKFIFVILDNIIYELPFIVKYKQNSFLLQNYNMI